MEPCLRLQQGVFNQCDCPTFSISVCVCFPPEPDGCGGRGWAADGGSDRGGDDDDGDALAAALLTWFLALPPVFTDRLSSVTGILGWIIRITLLLLKNTRS